MDNLYIYEACRTVPNEAIKPITAGRLKGKSDVNPMWRIKKLTEQFGPCGIGWKYVIKEKRLESSPNGEIAAFLDIDLFYKYDGQWSEAVPGTGGSSFVANERNGVYTSDECFKMALTDAISVACKALGIAADVYWNDDKTKYSGTNGNSGAENSNYKSVAGKPHLYVTKEKENELYALGNQLGYTAEKINKMVVTRYKKALIDLGQKEFNEVYAGFAGLLDKS